ncbi:paraquat-inducible protein A, partial [Salmonella enterica subsp. enterica serovar Anatum]|nr:paraquat-inducible protein A [Salmonella enterica subsp. enterica serovar Anatum]
MLEKLKEWVMLDIYLVGIGVASIKVQDYAFLQPGIGLLAFVSMVSMPSYDPNPFVKGISYQDYGKLLHDKNLPLINRVTQGLYP